MKINLQGDGSLTIFHGKAKFEELLMKYSRDRLNIIFSGGKFWGNLKVYVFNEFWNEV